MAKYDTPPLNPKVLQGQSPMHVAVRHGAYASIEVLQSRGADLNIQDHRVRAFTI